MNRITEEDNGTAKSKTNKNATLLEAINNDRRLNESRLQKLNLKLKLIPNVLKDNFGFILFIISGLGAFIQVVELSRIDLSYLRFFSVSQIASDGALVFVTLAISTLIGYAYYFFVTLKFREKNTSLYRENSPIKDIPIVKILLVLCLIVVYGCGVLANLMEVEDYRKNPVIFLILSAVMVALLAHFIKYSKYTNNEINRLEGIDKNKGFLAKGLLMYITILSYIFIPIVTMKTLMIYSEILREPRSFENYNKVGLVIRERHKNVSEYKVLYFNDKYTFIELTKRTSNEDTIEIYKTDAILFDETVIQIK